MDPRKPSTFTRLFISGEKGYHTYRIPALAVTMAGTVLAFCEGRKVGRSDSGDIALLLKRSLDNGRTWSDSYPRVVWDDPGQTCGNPCPVVDRETGTIWLLMTWNVRSLTERAPTHDGCTLRIPRMMGVPGLSPPR